jgi:Tfp pilus assembly major pilin PilA
MKSKQAGITLIGFLIVLVVVAFFGYMAMKLVPAYSEYMGVVKAMNQEASSGVDGRTLDSIRRDLSYKFSMQYVDDGTIAPSDITVTHDNGGNQLNISYDKETPFIYNIDFLIHFEKSVPLQGTIAQ